MQYTAASWSLIFICLGLNYFPNSTHSNSVEIDFRVLFNQQLEIRNVRSVSFTKYLACTCGITFAHKSESLTHILMSLPIIPQGPQTNSAKCQVRCRVNKPKLEGQQINRALCPLLIMSQMHIQGLRNKTGLHKWLKGSLESAEVTNYIKSSVKSSCILFFLTKFQPFMKKVLTIKCIQQF